MRPPTGYDNSPGSVLSRLTQDKRIREALIQNDADTKAIVSGLNVMHDHMPGIAAQVLRLVKGGLDAEAIRQAICPQIEAQVGASAKADVYAGFGKAMTELIRCEVIVEKKA